MKKFKSYITFMYFENIELCDVKYFSLFLDGDNLFVLPPIPLEFNFAW